jgi:drug/metabolite transporter (DMT)-like permease
MIQRQQTLWLLLATIGAILSFRFPFYTGSPVDNPNATEIIDAAQNFFLIVTTGSSAILSLVTIFLFKDRKLQIRLCLIGLAISILILVFYFLEIKKLNGTPSLYALLVLVIPISYFMAFRGIRADQKLVRSLDKLR